MPPAGGAARALAGSARFVWVGPMDVAKADAVDDEAGVQFAGLHDDMPAVYSAFDVFVLPSTARPAWDGWSLAPAPDAS